MYAIVPLSIYHKVLWQQNGFYTVNQPAPQSFRGVSLGSILWAVLDYPAPYYVNSDKSFLTLGNRYRIPSADNYSRCKLQPFKFFATSRIWARVHRWLQSVKRLHVALYRSATMAGFQKQLIRARQNFCKMMSPSAKSKKFCTKVQNAKKMLCPSKPSFKNLNYQYR